MMREVASTYASEYIAHFRKVIPEIGRKITDLNDARDNCLHQAIDLWERIPADEKLCLSPPETLKKLLGADK
jgi:hypothetical protein